MNNKHELIRSHFIIINIYYLLTIFHQSIFAVSSLDVSLFSAVLSGSVQSVEESIYNGANVNAVSSSGNTALHIAAENGYLQIVCLLLNKKASVNAINPTIIMANQNCGETPLHLAAQKGHNDVVQLLLKRGANIEALASDMVPRHEYNLVCRSSRMHRNLVFPSRRRPSVMQILNSQSTPLHRAAAGGHSETVRLLLERGANIQAVDANGRTPLHRAAAGGHSETVRALLERGANIEAVDWQGYTALHKAAFSGDSKTVLVLLEKGANIEAVNCEGHTSLYKAAWNGDIETVRLLLEKGSKTNTLNGMNHTSLHSAISFFLDDDYFMRRELVTSVYVVHVHKIKIFMELLLWYSYQSCTPRENDYETPVSYSIKQLIMRIDKLRLIFWPANKSNYLHQIKSLSRWIISEASHCQSKKEFLQKILDYLLGSHPIEEQNQLKENIKYLLLKNYLLNQNRLDFYELKSELSGVKLEKIKELESFLRYTYARKLKKELFNSFSKEDVTSGKDFKNKLDALITQESDLTALGKIRKLREITHPIIQYARDASTELSFKESILQADEASRMSALIDWIEQHHDRSFSSSAQKDLPRKELSARRTWSNWGNSYLRDSKQLLINIYNHLEYIIEHKGARLNSDTPFGRNGGMDILKFEK